MRKRVLLTTSGVIAALSTSVAQAATPAQKCAATKLEAATSKTSADN